MYLLGFIIMSCFAVYGMFCTVQNIVFYLGSKNNNRVQEYKERLSPKR